MTIDNAPEQSLEQIRISKEQAEKSVKLWKAFENLRDNKDFQLLISESYIKEEAARLVLLMSDRQFSGPENKIALENAMMGISALNQYFNSVVQLGAMAEESLAEYDNAMDEILEDELDEVH